MTNSSHTCFMLYTQLLLGKLAVTTSASPSFLSIRVRAQGLPPYPRGFCILLPVLAQHDAWINLGASEEWSHQSLLDFHLRQLPSSICPIKLLFHHSQVQIVFLSARQLNRKHPSLLYVETQVLSGELSALERL